MRKELQRRPHPMLSVLPVGLFAVVLVVDFAALVTGFPLFGAISLGVLQAALGYGLLALTALLVDFTISPVGSAARQARGLAGAITCAMVAVFAVTAWLRSAGDPAGNLGLFPTVDAAVEAAEAAFEQFLKRPLSDRKKAIDCIRRICVEQAQELGRAELEETKIGRLDHKIAKLDQTPIGLHIEHTLNQRQKTRH